MALNIKNENAHKMATELAKLRRVTVTQAVTDAIRHDLERESRLARNEDLAEELLAIGRICASHITRPLRSEDHAELLYDETGLPREDRS